MIDCNGTEIHQVWDDLLMRCTPPCVGSDEYVDAPADQIPLRDCKYFLYGGMSLSPTNTATNLDTVPYTAPGATSTYTDSGGIEAIIDGGWRPFAIGEDQSVNQYEDRPTAKCTGFWSAAAFAAQNPTGNSIPIADDPLYLPKWSVGILDTRRYPKLLQSGTGVIYTTTFDGYQPTNTSRYDRAYVDTIGNSRREYDPAYNYIVADGGWYQDGPDNTFFQTQCERATYILANYGGETPDFGNNIFACKMFDITNASYGDPDIIDRVFPEPDDLPALAAAAVRGPLDARKHENPVEWSSGGRRKIQFFGTIEMLRAWLLGRGEPYMESKFDYLEDQEYNFMRISPIEGSGTYDGEIQETAAFISTSINDVAPSLTAPRIKGDPDIFYYLSGGEGPVIDTGETIKYTSVSANCSYISTFVIDTDTEKSKIWQFPQVPWHNDPSAFERDFLVPVEDYNNMNCRNVNEYREYDFAKVVDPANPTFIIADINSEREIKPEHPRFVDYGGKSFVSKRGYFPPPVGHLRRASTFPGNNHISATDGIDMPIPNNFMPDNTIPLSGFYVHDIWDGSGFAVFPGQGTGQPPPDEPPGDTVGEPDPGDGVLPDPDANLERKCHKAWIEAGSPADYRLIADPDGEGCIKVPVIDGIGGCTTCITLTGGEVAPTSCGDYGGYFSGADPGAALGCNPVRDSSGALVGTAPVLDVAYLVKRASDHISDGCPNPQYPSLWDQKHSTSVVTGATNEPNIFCRTIYDNVGSIDELLPTIFDKYDSAITGEEILRKGSAFIDIDIVYDTIILRQQINNTQSYVFDRLEFSHEKGLSSEATSTHYIKTDDNDLSQLICHFFNEKENHIIAGVTRMVDDMTIYPELYMLSLDSHIWKKIYPATPADGITDFRLSPGDIANSPGAIISIDPGEISYNPVTDNYSVTYLGKLGLSEATSSTVIFNHMFSITP